MYKTVKDNIIDKAIFNKTNVTLKCVDILIISYPAQQEAYRAPDPACRIFVGGGQGVAAALSEGTGGLMANILQVTTPNINTDNRNILNPQDPRHAGGNPSVHNPVDPTRVVRADGQDGQQGQGAQDAALNIANYESNYGAFIKGLGESNELSGALERLLYPDMAGLKEGSPEIGALVDKFLLSVRMDSPQDLLTFLEGQRDLQAMFTGDFFDKFRAMLSQNPSDSLAGASLAFLKGYTDYAAGSHLLQQMHTLLDDIENLLMRSYRAEFRELAEGMDWAAANGDTAQNMAHLNGRLIPFLSSYISGTHDYGAVREAAMLLIFNAARYQNGDGEKLQKLFDDMASDRDFARLFKGDAKESLEGLLSQTGRVGQPFMQQFADGLSKLLLHGANGQGGLENVQQFYTIMNGMLINESVYMPLLHFLIPFQYEDNNVVSEMWVDPDAKREYEDDPRRVKLFLKFDIQSLGKFELAMNVQDREAQMQLFVPQNLAKQGEKIQADVGDILKRNKIRLSQILVRQRIRDRRLDEVFPEIREKERTINVRI